MSNQNNNNNMVVPDVGFADLSKIHGDNQSEFMELEEADKLLQDNNTIQQHPQQLPTQAVTLLNAAAGVQPIVAIGAENYNATAPQ